MYQDVFYKKIESNEFYKRNFINNFNYKILKLVKKQRKISNQNLQFIKGFINFY